jgi:hypothetical protein
MLSDGDGLSYGTNHRLGPLRRHALSGVGAGPNDLAGSGRHPHLRRADRVSETLDTMSRSCSALRASHGPSPEGAVGVDGQRVAVVAQGVGHTGLGAVLEGRQVAMEIEQRPAEAGRVLERRAGSVGPRAASASPSTEPARDLLERHRPAVKVVR